MLVPLLSFSSPDVPQGAPPVTQRTLFLTDGTGKEFEITFGGDVTQTTIEDIPTTAVFSHESPGSCYLVDNNAAGEEAGNSTPSAAFTLDPGDIPPPVVSPPNQPSILGVEWVDTDAPQASRGGAQRIDRRNKR